MKFCKFFPLAVLSSVLTCSCSADYISKRIGAGPSSTVYSYEHEWPGSGSAGLCSLVVEPYRILPFSVAPNTFLIENIAWHYPSSVSLVRSLLFNVINSVTKENINENNDYVKFSIHIPKSESEECSHSSFVNYDYGTIIDILKSLGFKKDENVNNDLIDRKYAFEDTVSWRLFVCANGLTNIKDVSNLEIKDCKK